ncbi:hypothetical protein [Nocardia gipuzkoensis]
MKEHTDEVRINLRVVADLQATPTDDWTLRFQSRTVDQAEVRQFIRDEFPQQDQFVLRENRIDHEWGNSAMVWAFVAEMAPQIGEAIATGVAGNAAWDALKSMARRLPRLWGADEEAELLPITESSGVREARNLIRERYQPDEELNVAAFTFDDQTSRATVVLRTPSGTTYEVELIRTADGVSIARSSVRY